MSDSLWKFVPPMEKDIFVVYMWPVVTYEVGKGSEIGK